MLIYDDSADDFTWRLYFKNWKNDNIHYSVGIGKAYVTIYSNLFIPHNLLLPGEIRKFQFFCILDVTRGYCRFFVMLERFAHTNALIHTVTFTLALTLLLLLISYSYPYSYSYSYTYSYCYSYFTLTLNHTLAHIFAYTLAFTITNTFTYLIAYCIHIVTLTLTNTHTLTQCLLCK